MFYYSLDKKEIHNGCKTLFFMLGTFIIHRLKTVKIKGLFLKLPVFGLQYN